MKKPVLMIVVGACVGLVGMTSGHAQSQPGGVSTFDFSDDTSDSDSNALQRDGLFAGISFGRGSIDVDCGDCASGGGVLTEALSLETHVGYMVTPQLGLVGEHWTIRYNARGGALFDDSTPHLVAQHVSSLGAQLYLGKSIWVRTGLGIGWHISDGDYAKRPGPSGQTQSVTTAGGNARQLPPERAPLEAITGPGASYFAAVGWEVAHNRSFVAEIQLRAASTQRTDQAYEVRNVGLNIGASWY